MSIPDFQTLMLPLLRFVASGERHIRDVVEHLSDEFQLTADEREALLPSGKQHVIANRAHWAGTFLVQAGLMTRPSRGRLRITKRGQELLQSNPQKIDVGLLRQYPEFLAFKSRKNSSDDDKADVSLAPESGQTPEERIDEAAVELDATLRAELLERIVSAPPEFFEHLIVDLMLAMGYGKAGQGRHVGRNNDGGIDGIISEDALGLDLVLLQAKRYQEGNGIGAPKIQEFVGSLVGSGANKGVFVTTSHFSAQARQFAERVKQRVILIDGEELTKLCIQYRVGVRAIRTVELKRIDLDYFGIDG